MAYTIINNGDSALTIRTKLNQQMVHIANVLTDVSVPTSAWVSDTTYTNYPYRAAITVADCLATDIPFVAFNASDQESGNYIGADSAAGIIYIYASAIPSSAMTIPTVMALRMAVTA
jgi:hypothetical protein